MRWYLDAGPDADVVLSTRIRLARNLKQYAFPARLSPGLAEEAYARIAEAFFSAHEGMRADYHDLRLRDLPEIARLALVEKRLMSEDLLQNSDLARVILRKDEGVSLLLGEEDHLRIQVMQAGYDLAAAYEEAERLARFFEERLDLAYDPHLGFLTACPSNVGTGLRASVMVHLPALGQSEHFPRYLDALRKAGFAVRGSYGEHSAVLGHFYQISNQYTLGLSEAETLEELQTAIDDLVRQERSLRAHLLAQDPIALHDQVFRAYGLLSEARLLRSQEIPDPLSSLRLGLALHLFDEALPSLDVATLNALSYGAGAAALQQQAGQPMDARARDEARANWFRQGLAKARLPQPGHGPEDSGPLH